MKFAFREPRPTAKRKEIPVLQLKIEVGKAGVIGLWMTGMSAAPVEIEHLTKVFKGCPALTAGLTPLSAVKPPRRRF